MWLYFSRISKNKKKEDDKIHLKIAYVGYKLITKIYWLSLGKVSQCLGVFILQ